MLDGCVFYTNQISDITMKVTIPAAENTVLAVTVSALICLCLTPKKKRTAPSKDSRIMRIMYTMSPITPGLVRTELMGTVYKGTSGMADSATAKSIGRRTVLRLLMPICRMIV